jgi:hypothetical protein
MKLLRKFPPIPDESGLGVYRRLSAANGLTGWKELAVLCELPVAQSALLLRPDHVAECLGMPHEWAQIASSAHERAAGWRGLRRKGDAVCPHCLRMQVYMRVHWEHAYVVACPEHRVMLVDRCNACGERLASHRERIEQCPCGYDLRNVPAPAASPAVLWVASLLSNCAVSVGDLGPPVEGVTVDVLSLLVRTLCVFSNPRAVGARQNAPVPRTIQEATIFLQPMEGLLEDWPRGFEEHVSKRLACASPDARTLSTALGKWYVVLKSCCTEGPLQCFFEAIARVAAAEFDGLTGLDSAAAATNRAASQILLAEAARRIGVHRDTLFSYVKRGQLRSEQKKFGTRGLAYVVSVQDVDEVMAARREWMLEEQACDILDIPPSVLLRLAAAGLVQHDTQWTTDLRKGGPVELASVTAFSVRLAAHNLGRGSSGGARIALRELNGRRSGDGKALIRTLQAIAEGEILPLNRAKTVGRLEYAMADVGRYFSTPILEAGLSVQGLSQLTGWKWESISHWIDLGLLQSTTIQLRGQPCRVVSPQALVEFSRTYVPLADLAKQLGSKSSAVAERLSDLELLGAKPLADGQRRGALVRVQDLARLALSSPRGLTAKN